MKLAERVKRRRRCSEVAETDLEIDARLSSMGKARWTSRNAHPSSSTRTVGVSGFAMAAPIV